MKVNRVSVKFLNGMCGVFMNYEAGSGEIIHDLSSGVECSTPTRTSIQIENGIHTEDPIGAFINHDCRPSCKILGYKVITIADLSVGDEVTFDYSENEDVMASPFTCRCCGKLIRGKD